MQDAEALYQNVASQIPDAISGKLFGKPCYKINGKAFCCFFQGEMVFKLDEESRVACLNLEGTHLFDPSGKGRPMKAWVQVPVEYHEHWHRFAVAAAHFTGNL